MKVLVTGAGGRVGRYTIEALQEAGLEVHATDMLYQPKLDRDLPFEVADLTDVPTIYRLLKGMDAIVHLGNSPDSNTPDLKRVFHNNVTANMNVFHAAADLGVRRVVWASSIQVISGDRVAHRDEEDPGSSLAYLPIDDRTPANPGNMYALSKHFGEQTLAFECEKRGLVGASVRLPYVASRRAMEYMSRRLSREPYSGRRDEVSAYLAGEDAGRLFAAFVQAEGLEGHRVYMPSAPDMTVDLPVAEYVQMHFPNVPLREPADSLSCLVDYRHITREIGWAPRVSLREQQPAA